MRRDLCAFVVGISAAVGVVACGGDDTNGSGAQSDAGSQAGDAGGMHDSSSPAQDAGGADAANDAPATPANAVYTMTNAPAGNQVIGFARANDGSLSPMAAPFATGGKGTGAGLGEQGAITIDRAANRLYVVNAGDDSFSILPIETDGSLGAAVHVAAGSGLVGPKSITYRGDVVYVLFEGNATTPSAISGWTVSASGASPIAGSTAMLSSTTKSVDPAQIQFTPDGKYLVATEKGTSSIDTFAVDANGVATKVGFYGTASDGDGGTQLVPYGFAFVGDTLVVSEAGSTGVGAYSFANGVVAPVGAAQFLPTDPAPCWVAASFGFAYVANARGPDISGFSVAANGALANVGSAANGVVASTGKKLTTDGGVTIQGPTDEAVSSDGKYLYVLDSAVPAIGVFKVNNDGTLTRVGGDDYTNASLAAGVVGIAAR